MKILALAALLLFLSHPSTAQDPTFDLHVHLRNGAESIDEYQAQVTSAKRQVTAFGGMWFGGPHQALQGDVEHTRAQNEALITLASKHPKMLPIATVHPYDGQAALEELKRVAGRGVKMLKTTSPDVSPGAPADVPRNDWPFSSARTASTHYSLASMVTRIAWVPPRLTATGWSL